MPAEPFLAALRGAKLLDPARMADLAAWAEQAGAGDREVVAELLRRGWLTKFQIREVHFGRGKGLTLGPYVLLEPIGEGGMGRVFKARHARLGREAALKVIRKEKLTRPVVAERFRTEVRALGQLSHPNVVLAFDAGEAAGVLYYAMEYVEGVDLTKLVQQNGPAPVPLACEYVRQAALGLQHAAERGLVHRDVKPSNLLVTPRGQVKVLDLGLALLKEDPGRREGDRLTEHGLVLGTPDFLSPEQIRNPQAVDARADVYALGATLYFLLTARTPYEGATPADKMIQHVTAPPPSALPYRPDVPPGLDAVVRWMMAKRPADRPQAPAHAAAALAPFCPGAGGGGYAPPAAAAPLFSPPPAPVVAAVPTPPTAVIVSPLLSRPAAPRHRPRSSGAGLWVAAGVVVGLAALGGLAVLAFVLLGEARPTAPPPAEAEFTNSAGLRMVPLPGGPFTMGSPPGEPGRQPDEGPAGRVTVSGPFHMSAHEVTDGQLAAVLGRTHSVYPKRLRQAGAAPADSVTWAEAVEFCRKLTAREPERRPGWAYRLPTEAEWEYACRAGSTTPFWSGDKLTLGRSAIFDLDQGEKDGLGEADPGRRVEKGLPYPVGSTDPNRFGLSDTSGNVWEWCSDFYAPDYAGRAAVDPTGPPTGELRVVRGGSWREPAARCRSAARRGLDPAVREPDVGFRVVYAPTR